MRIIADVVLAKTPRHYSFACGWFRSTCRWYGLISFIFLVLPGLARASLPASSEEILCWSAFVVRGQIEDANPDPEYNLWYPGAHTRGALVQVKVEEILGIPARDDTSDVPKVGTTAQFPVEFVTEGSPMQDGIALSIPDHVIVGKPKEIAAYLRGKQFIFSARPDYAAHFHNVEIWRAESDIWVKETLLSSEGQNDGDGAVCPRPVFAQANARYSVNSPEMNELMGYAHDLVEAQSESILIFATETTVVNSQNISSAWRVTARAMLSDQMIEALLGYYRSREGREFVFLQHRLEPILSRAQRELNLHYESYSRPRSEPLPQASPEISELLSLALSEQVGITPRSRGLPFGPYTRPELASVAALIAGSDLDRLRIAYRPYLSSFRKFRRSPALTEFLEAGFAAQNWCSAKVNCGI
jgi:hypothetical protein